MIMVKHMLIIFCIKTDVMHLGIVTFLKSKYGYYLTVAGSLDKRNNALFVGPLVGVTAGVSLNVLTRSGV